MFLTQKSTATSPCFQSPLTATRMLRNPPNSPAATRCSLLFSPTVRLFSFSWLRHAADENKPTTTTSELQNPAAVTTEEVVVSRIYYASVIGEPMAVGKDKRKAWEKLMNARVVYLGEAEQVPVKDDRELELQIVKNLRKRCVESGQTMSLALEVFRCDLQDQLNQ